MNVATPSATARYRIERIEQETPDVKRFLLDGPRIRFTPGQFAMVKLDPEAEGKPFTYANAPGERVELAVKRMDEEGFTARLHELREGDSLLLEGPEEAELEFDEETEKTAFIAGGSGITPFIAALRHAEKRGSEQRFLLLYSNRTEKDILYEEELERLSKELDLTVVHTLTQEETEDAAAGRVDEELIRSHTARPSEYQWYLCGPQGLVEDMRSLLTQLGVLEERIRSEEWQLPGKHEQHGG